MGNQTVPVFIEARSVAPQEKSDLTRQPWNAVQTVDLSAEDTQERCRARPESCLGGCTRCCARPVASVEEGHDVERVAETMRVNDERVVSRREGW